MSLYRYNINNRSIRTTGDTISPMINSATSNQSFSEYLKIYNVTQSKNGVYSRKNISGPNNGTLKDTSDTNKFPISSFYSLREDLKDARFTLIDTKTYVSSGNTIDSRLNYKNIVIPIETNFDVVDYGDDIQFFIKKETEKLKNKPTDGERIKYVSEIFPDAVTIKFRFYDKDNNQFDNLSLDGGYNLAGFDDDEINKKNNFKKSFFRLYFFDSNNTKTQNLLSIEDIDVFNSTKPSFSLGRIYWLKNDELFINTIDNREIYMEAKFFNSKTGRVHRFINTPDIINQPINISTFSNNLEWKSSKLLILNPKNNNNNRFFRVLPGIGANTPNVITLTEYILQT